MTEVMRSDREARAAAAAIDSYLQIGSEARDLLGGLRQDVLERTRERIASLVREWHETSQELEHSVRQLAAIPSPEAIAHLLTSREERRIAVRAAEARVAALNQEVERLGNEIAQAELSAARCRRANLEEAREAEDAQRTVDHIDRVKGTLSQFRTALFQRHARRIESLALDSLRQLLRKERLVSGLTIDADTFEVTLTEEGGSVLPGERLSAGERQLVATALLWGLRRAAGRVVPLVIDTPLGRLDSSYRMHPVTRYFPYASHQTILLSTDEEFTGPYYDALRPWLASEYTLTIDERARNTFITAGYSFSSRNSAHVA
jgi:DNA sulfur modification protein DndD